MSVLLSGSAVNYAVRDQDPGGLRVGSVSIERPPRPDRDLAAMKDAGVAVFFVHEDAAERGIAMASLEPACEPISRTELPALLARHDQVWQW